MQLSTQLLPLLQQERMDRINRYASHPSMPKIRKQVGWDRVPDLETTYHPRKINWCLESEVGPVNMWFESFQGLPTEGSYQANNWQQWTGWSDHRFSTFEQEILVFYRVFQLVAEDSWRQNYRPLVNKRARIDTLEREGFWFEVLVPHVPTDPPMSFDSKFARSIIAGMTCPEGEYVSFRKLSVLEGLIQFIQGTKRTDGQETIAKGFSVDLEYVRRFCYTVKQCDKAAGNAAFKVFLQIVRGEVSLDVAPPAESE